MSGSKGILKVILVIAISAALLGCVGENEDNGDDDEGDGRIIQNVSVSKASGIISDNDGSPDFVLLDIRTPDEFNEERLAGSVNLDYYESSFESDLDAMDKSRMYLIYCRTGTRSGNALDMMDDLDFEEVYNMLGGIVDWKESGRPTVTGAP